MEANSFEWSKVQILFQYLKNKFSLNIFGMKIEIEYQKIPAESGFSLAAS